MKKIILAFIISIMILAGTSQSVNINENDITKISTEIIFVNNNNTEGPWDGSYHNPYQTITDGVNNAEKEDIVYVLNGIYNEQIIINKSIHLIGEEKEETIINTGYKEYGIKIKEDNVIIEQFTIKNSGGYKENSAVKIIGKKNKISDCIIKRARVGILINNTQENTIENCTIYLCGKGIYSKKSQNLYIKNTEIGHCGIAAILIESSKIDIKNSYIHESGTSCFIYDSEDIYFEKIGTCDNNDNGGGIKVQNSKNIDFINCNFLHNGFGLRTLNSNNIKVDYCSFNNLTHFGIWLKSNSEDITIERCDLTNNFRHCIYMENSQCNVKESNLYNNQVDSVNLEDSLCIAKNNYWGGILGPAFNKGFRLIDIIKFHFRKIKYIPWKIEPYQNIGSDWKVEDKFTKTIVHGYEDEEIEILGVDSDSDGIPDWWEEEFNYNATKWDDHKNLDPDEDKLNNIEECYAYEWGADPFFKDIFLEFDWTISKTEGASNKPSQEIVNEMKERFLEHDINLHVDLGMLNGSEIVPYKTDIREDELTDIYWDYFLHNDLNNPRKNIFHYGFICDTGPGSGFAVIAWGHLNSFCISADVLKESFPKKPREKLITHASMHELGHTMGLVVDDFGGNDNHAATNPKYPEFWIYNSYKSLMNYRYTYSILDFSDGDNGILIQKDYNDWAGMEFDFFKNTHFEWPKA